MSIAGMTKLQEKEITEILSRFGLKEKEQSVYMTLLQLGQITVTPLARAVGLPVTTVQSILLRLTETGLIFTTKRKSRHAYEAHDPVVLRRILERQAEEVAGIVPLLQSLKGDLMLSPKIKVYYRERMADIFHEALKSKNKLVYEIVSAQDLQEILGEKFHFTKRRVKNHVKLKSLRVEAYEIKKYSKKAHVRELREAKFLPRELSFRSSIMFWDNTVAFFTTKEEGLAWTVTSKTFRETVEQIFMLLWSVSRRMETLMEDE